MKTQKFPEMVNIRNALLALAGLTILVAGFSNLSRSEFSQSDWVNMYDSTCADDSTLKALFESNKSLGAPEEREIAQGLCEKIGQTYSGQARCLNGQVQISCRSLDGV